MSKPPTVPMPANVRRELLQLQRRCQRQLAQCKRRGESTTGLPEADLLRELNAILEHHPTPPPRKDMH